LRWFGHIQRKPHEAPIRSDILSHPENIKREKDRPRLTWEGAVKRYLKKYNISKELGLKDDDSYY
jgi:hypothetical protein